MAKKYRNWDERCEIFRSMIAEKAPRPISEYGLTQSEEIYYRARVEKAIETLARDSSSFKQYYSLPTAKPFAYVVVTSVSVMVLASLAAMVVYWNTRDTPAYPVYSALIAIGAAAAGWWVIGRMTHRNVVRQNTNTMVFARFSHTAFNDAMTRFHMAFGYDQNERVTRESILALRDPTDPEKFSTSNSALFLLNYYEFIASGVINGDLDAAIIKDNLRGVICYYYDKCEPYVRHANSVNPKAFQNLIKLRTHYRPT